MESEEFSTGVGSTLLFENSEVRVWDFSLAPGEWSKFHRHECDYVIAYVTSAEIGLEVFGQSPETSEVVDGYVSYTSVGSAADPRLTHRLGNIGKAPLRHLVVELVGKRSGQNVRMQIESNDPAEALQEGNSQAPRSDSES